MEVIPCLGIGDLLLLKMVDLEHHLNIKKIHLSKPLIKSYRKYPDRTIGFLNKFLTNVFPAVEVDVVDRPHKAINLKDYPIQSMYLYDQIQVSPQFINPIYQDLEGYIVFHTKVRLESRRDMFNFKLHDLPLVKEMFQHLKVGGDKTLILLGERTIEESAEQKGLDIISLYSELCLLVSNNHVLDLTKPELCSGNPDYEDFERDMNIIHFATLNISFGIGGNTNLCHAFSLNNVTFWGPCNVFKFLYDKYHGSYTSIEPFIDEINKRLSV